MRYFIINLLCLVSIWLWSTGASCTKVVAYGVDHQTQALTHTYSSNISNAMEQTEAALESLGYKILRVDESRHRITTGWQPVKSHSHYMNLFNRKDFAASDGAYFQLIADIFSDGPGVKVAVSTKVKSIAGRLSSSYVAEKQALGQIDNFMRSPQIEMTNVGVKGR